MKKIFLLTLFLLLGVSSFAQKQNYVIGFYNVENLFDITGRSRNMRRSSPTSRA